MSMGVAGTIFYRVHTSIGITETILERVDMSIQVLSKEYEISAEYRWELLSGQYYFGALYR